MTSVIEYCPSGFVTPNWIDWGGYINAAANVTNREGKDEMRQDPFLRLTAAGLRQKDNGVVFDLSVTSVLEEGIYWADSATPVKSYVMYFYRGNPTPTPPQTPISPLIKSLVDLTNPIENSHGFSIRCVKR